MKTARRNKLFLTLVAAAASLVVPATGQALLLQPTNTAAVSVDGASATRSVVITPADITEGTGTVQDVNIRIDFAKCSGSINLDQTTGGCDTPQAGLDAFLSDITFTLVHPDGTPLVVLISQNSYAAPPTVTTGGRVEITFDDNAPTPVSGDTLVGGSFQPVAPDTLSEFNGLSAIGQWDLIIDDGFAPLIGTDPLGFFNYTLLVTTDSGPPTGGVPAPGTLLLLGLGLAGLGAARRTKR